MKTSLFNKFLAFVFFLLLSFPCKAQWTTLNSPVTTDLLCVEYTALGYVWMGTSQGVLRSINSGATLSFVNGLDASLGNTQINGTFEAIHATSTSNALGVGFFNTGNDLFVFSTNNGGSSWVQNYFANAGTFPRYFTSIEFNNANIGVAVGSNGRVIYSTNNGVTWSIGNSLLNYLATDIAWSTASVFVAIANGAFFRSVNGGQNWSFINSASSSIENISFAPNSPVGYAGGGNQLKKTVDGGLTWTNLLPPTGNISALTAVSPDTMFLATNQDLYRSYSGGRYWESFHLPNYKTLSDICFYDGNNGIAVGKNGYAIKTTNGGGVPYPVPFFNLSSGTYCEGGTVIATNLSDTSHTFQWWVNGVMQSTQYSPVLNLNVSGNTLIQLIENNGVNVDTTSTSINVIPIPILQPFVVLHDSICVFGQGTFQVPNSITSMTYSLFDGGVQVGTSKFGTGGTISLLTATNQSVVKPYTIRAIANNGCGNNTLDVYDSLWLAIPHSSLTMMLSRDTICLGDTTFLVIQNSEIGWEYFCTVNQNPIVEGTGGTIAIPILPQPSPYPFLVTLRARYKRLACVYQMPNSFPVYYFPTTVAIGPGTLQGSVGQPVNMFATSTYFNNWEWTFGNNAFPLNGSGQIPSPPIYTNVGVDTVILTVKLYNACTQVVRKPVYIYSNPPVSSTLLCDVDTSGAYMGTTDYKYCLDEYNYLHIVGYQAQSTNFDFTPSVMSLDSNSIGIHFTTYNSTGNSLGAQGLINGITSDRLSNIYFATHYVADSRFDIQGNFIRNINALVKLNEKGKFQWAIETPLADFSDMITLDGRIFALGINAWNGLEFQTPVGYYEFKPSISNKGEAFIMELNSQGKILNIDAFGGTGQGGVSKPAKFNVKYPIINQFFAYDTLRQNLMARKSASGGLLISGLLDANSIGAQINFSNQIMSNVLPVGTAGEKCLFVSRYDIDSGFTSVTSLMSGKPEYIQDYIETNSGHIVFVGIAKNKIVTTNGTIIFPVQNYGYQFVASFSSSGTLDWIVYADSMDFKSITSNNDGSVNVLAYMKTKFLFVDGMNIPYNLSPIPSLGTFMLRLGSSGELISGEKISGNYAVTMKQDACGNHHVFQTSAALGNSIIRTTHSNSGSCSSNCYALNNPLMKDAVLDSVNLSDVSTGGPSQRDVFIKVRSRSVLPISSLEVKCRINNDPVQSLNWTGTMGSGDVTSFALSAYNFNNNYNRIRVWIESVNGSIDDFPENDTIIKSQIICLAPLAGTYSVGCDTCYFDKIQASATTLKTCGVSGPVTIEIEPGHYFEQVRIDSVPFASNVDSVVWTSRTGYAEDVILELGCNYSYSRNLLHLYRTKFCTIDHLTIKNILPRKYDNMQIELEAQLVMRMERVFDVNLTDCILFTLTSTNVDCFVGNNVRILNNYISGGTYAISADYSRNLIVKGNHSQQNGGMRFYEVDRLLIDKNKLESMGRVYTSKLNIENCDSVIVTSNLVTNEREWGALKFSCSGNTPNSCLIANNIFSSLSIMPQLPSGEISGELDVINNSFGNGVRLTGLINFVNNLVRSNYDHVIHDGSGVLNTFNYNRYQSIGAPISFRIGTITYNLADWRTNTGYDINSDSVTAEYTTLTDMHLRNAVSMPGIPWPGITKDIDGDLRGSIPTIGADEHSFNPLLSVVWPGDCDSSKNVDNFDMLPIGLYYNHYSTSRPYNPSAAWVAQASLPWSELQGNGVNVNHADANGDGWIDLDDTSVVVSNYGMSHPFANPTPQSFPVGPDLTIVPVGNSFTGGDTVHLKVMAGTALLGINKLAAFGLQVPVPPSLIAPGSFTVTLNGNWICPDSLCVQYANANETNGIAAFSLARIDGDGPSGYGELADISFVVNAAYTGNPLVTFSPANYQSFEPNSIVIPLSPVNGNINIVNTSVTEISLFDGLLVYPNPLISEGTLLMNWRGASEEKVQLNIMDISGRSLMAAQKIVVQNGVNKIQLSVDYLQSGLYFIELRQAHDRKLIRFVKK